MHVNGEVEVYLHSLVNLKLMEVSSQLQAQVVLNLKKEPLLRSE